MCRSHREAATLVNCNLAGRARGQWRTSICVIRDSRAVPGNVFAQEN